MPRGDVALVKLAAGAPGIRRIWDDGPQQALVCHEEAWQRWQREGTAPTCQHMRRDHVFRPNEALARRLDHAARLAQVGDVAASTQLQRLWKEAAAFYP